MPDAKLIALSMYANKSFITEMLKAGDGKIRILIIDSCTFMRGGYKLLIEKHNDFEVVGDTGESASGIRTVSEGEKYLCPQLMTIIANSWANQVSVWDPPEVRGFLKYRAILKDIFLN